ncbi:hypothetical protein ZIOFF_017429 [Zingiber officinale]|uniref:Uncharacterized protein n=1 Tax=Zingiber officinale TaxID=94328 RepID=A0A8J5LPI1_ZINOF|nr:hypothetical protein ZIOFF_017429 [Zingiber officinale]
MDRAGLSRVLSFGHRDTGKNGISIRSTVPRAPDEQLDFNLFHEVLFLYLYVPAMGLSKTEVNLRRLLEAAPRQQNKTKLIHVSVTMGTLIDAFLFLHNSGINNACCLFPVILISKAKLNEYSEKIEALAAKLAAPLVETEEVSHVSEEASSGTHEAANHTSSSSVLRRRTTKVIQELDKSPTARLESKESRDEAKERDSTEPVKLDAPAIAHIEKHRKLQEDLTDEMVGLARQLKESSLLMNKSLQDTEKASQFFSFPSFCSANFILDSTENAVEHSLASTSRANKRAMEVYSESFKTSCFTWIVIFVMTCVFFMVVLLIRVT